MAGTGNAPTGPAAVQEPPRAPKSGAAAAKTVAAAPREGVDMDFLLDVPLEVTVEVGRTKMLVNDLLQLQQGSVIDLEKMVGEPFEVYVNKKLMAYGEVVVVNEKFGIRLTDIIDPKERIQQLG
jgi:flagellar motor switch protein FliN/FliY